MGIGEDGRWKMKFGWRLYETSRRYILSARDGVFLVVVSGGLEDSGEN